MLIGPAILSSVTFLKSFRRQQQLTDLTESAITRVSADKIDKENGVIRDVKILGRFSQKGRREYTETAINEACTHYEGLEVNLNHPNGNKGVCRALVEGWGVIRNAHPGGDGAFGDLHYLKSHPDTPWLLERIERGMPIGLSHNARGYTRNENGKEIVESVPIAFSADLVSRPGSVKNLFESDGDDMTIRDFLATADKNADGYKALVEMSIDPVVADAVMGMPAEGEDGIKSAILSAINAKLSTADQPSLKKVLKALGIEDSMSANASNGGDGTAPTMESINAAVTAAVTAATKPLTESLTATTKELESVKKRDAARSLLESYNTNVSVVGADKFKQLCESADEPAMKALVESWPPAIRGAAKPQIQGTTELTESASVAPASFEGVRSLLRSR